MKSILITGVSRGIGRTLATRFSSLGFKVYGVYKSSDEYKEEDALAAQLKQELPALNLLPYDLANRESISSIAGELAGIQMSGIIHNAAEFLENRFDELSAEVWDRSLAVNVTAPLLLTHTLSSQIIDSGSVVMIASTDANYAAYDDIGYAASKAALINITKSLAAALAPRKIRVNAILPGWVDTQMAENANISKYSAYQTPLGRNATTEEIADFVEYLVSDKSTFINAAALTIDGGYSSTDYTVKKESEQ